MLTQTGSGLMGRVGRWTGWHLGRGAGSCRPAWPITVGAVVVPPGWTQWAREQDRVALALGAYRRGLFLLDMLDVPIEEVEPGQAWAPVWDLAVRAMADAVVVYVPVRERASSIPSEHRGIPVHVVLPRD